MKNSHFRLLKSPTGMKRRSKLSPKNRGSTLASSVKEKKTQQEKYKLPTDYFK